MRNFVYTTYAEALRIYEKTIYHSGGGELGGLELEKLESILTFIQNDDYYPTIEDKITHLIFAACEFHCFCDGNKRMALVLALNFLLHNGYLAICNVFFKNMENIIYHVAAGNISKDLLHDIVQAMLSGTYDNNEALQLSIVNAISKAAE